MLERLNVKNEAFTEKAEQFPKVASSTYSARDCIKYSGVEVSGRNGGDRTWQAA